ncbi:hypothetical protein RIF29_25168 [Crotalaria pallida]|uniref:Uncharacterized protein n=1 Tax=Crotalaria pallida TaxID=3830 RepID=A0AAN9EL33_CROPI
MAGTSGAIGSGASVANDYAVGRRRLAHDADGSGARVLAAAASLQAGAAALASGAAGARPGAASNETHGKGPQIGAQNLNQDAAMMQGELMRPRLIMQGCHLEEFANIDKREKKRTELITKPYDMALQAEEKDILKQYQMTWKSLVFSNIDTPLHTLIIEIDVLESKVNLVSFTFEEPLVKRIKMTSLRQLALENKGSLISQKSKVQWIKEGDENMAYFHAWLAPRRRNMICDLKESGR